MQIAVLGSPTSWYLRDLQRAAGDQHCIVAAGWTDVASRVEGRHVGVNAGSVDFAHCDATLVRTMPAGSLEQVVFRMDALAQLQAAGQVVVNSPRAVETAVDKYLTLARLARADLPVPTTVACQSFEAALAAFESLGRDVVVKPLFGSEGRGLMRVQEQGMAERLFQLLVAHNAVIYLQQFVPHPGYDLRVLVIGERMLAMRRRSQHDWRTNLARGAQGEPIELTPELASLAERAADAVGASLAGVDILPGPDGRLYLIEVNAVPGWRGLAQALDVDVAQLVLDHLAAVVRAQRSL